MRSADAVHRLILLLFVFPAAVHAQYPTSRSASWSASPPAGRPTCPRASSPTGSAPRSGQRVVVENRPRAGQIATQDVLAKPRDGYHLLLCTHFEAINAAVYKSVPYKLTTSRR